MCFDLTHSPVATAARAAATGLVSMSTRPRCRGHLCCIVCVNLFWAAKQYHAFSVGHCLIPLPLWLGSDSLKARSCITWAHDSMILSRYYLHLYCCALTPWSYRYYTLGTHYRGQYRRLARPEHTFGSVDISGSLLLLFML